MASNSNTYKYINYFRQLAVRHTELLHNPAAEAGDTTNGDNHFAKWNLNELVGNLRTTCKFPALLLELYEIKTEAQIVYDIRQPAQGAITVLQHVDQGDTLGEEDAYALTEKIMYDLMKEIWQDHYGEFADRCETPFQKFDFDGIGMQSTGKILQNEYGWRIEFAFRFQNEMNIAEAPVPGTFNPTIPV